MRKKWPEYYLALFIWLVLPPCLVWFSRWYNPFHIRTIKSALIALAVAYAYYTLHRNIFRYMYQLRRNELSRQALLLILEEADQMEREHGSFSRPLGDDEA